MVALHPHEPDCSAKTVKRLAAVWRFRNKRGRSGRPAIL